MGRGDGCETGGLRGSHCLMRTMLMLMPKVDICRSSHQKAEAGDQHTPGLQYSERVDAAPCRGAAWQPVREEKNVVVYFFSRCRLDVHVR